MRVSAVSDSGWRAGEDDVSWLQCGEFGDCGDECGDAEDQVGKVGFLDGLPVQGCADACLGDVDFCRGDDVGAADHHMGVLLSADGPFKGCKPIAGGHATNKLKALPCEAEPSRESCRLFVGGVVGQRAG